ncbi:MAG: hypothetical protein QXK00_02340 [archaeon]
MAADWEDYEEGRGLKRYEITIPLLLLIFIFFIIAWKFNWLVGLPVIGEILYPKAINVLIVGNDLSIQQSLQQMQIGLPINYHVLSANEIPNIISPDYLKKYDLVILTEYAGNNPGELPQMFRSHLVKYLQGGGKLILYGVAGSIDPESPTTDGWKQEGLNIYIPVTCTSRPCQKETFSAADLIILIRQPEHRIVKEFGYSTNFSDSPIEITKVNPENEEVFVIKDNLTRVVYPGVVEKSFGITGKTVYFSYHPSKHPVIFKNTISYLFGR